MTASVTTAFALTIIAGLSTGIGSTIAYFIKKPRTVYLTFALGFSSGVMVYVSFVELLPASIEILGELKGVAAFFVGIVFAGVLDLLTPKAENPHHFMGALEKTPPRGDPFLSRTGMFTALVIAIHNLPEGLAAFGAALNDTRLGIIVTLAVAIHNIPEGVAVSMPIFFASGSRKKAFFFSFASGLAEPIGALIGFLIIRPFLNEAFLVSLLAFVSGIMVYISFDEILPTAYRYGQGHSVITGTVLGMLIMAVSLILL